MELYSLIRHQRLGTLTKSGKTLMSGGLNRMSPKSERCFLICVDVCERTGFMSGSNFSEMNCPGIIMLGVKHKPLLDNSDTKIAARAYEKVLPCR